MGCEEGLQDADSLSTAAGAGLGEDGNFKIIRKPGREALGVTLGEVFSDGDKHIIRLSLCESRCAAEKNCKDDYQLYEILH